MYDIPYIDIISSIWLHDNSFHSPALRNKVCCIIFDKINFWFCIFCIPQQECAAYRIVFEKNMAPLVFDIDEGGQHHGNHEDNDCENNNLGYMEMMI